MPPVPPVSLQCLHCASGTEAVGHHLPSASLPRPPVPAYPKFHAPAGFHWGFLGCPWVKSVIKEQDPKLLRAKEPFDFFLKALGGFTAFNRSSLEPTTVDEMVHVGFGGCCRHQWATCFEILNGVSWKSENVGSEGLFPRPHPGLLIFLQPC